MFLVASFLALRKRIAGGVSRPRSGALVYPYRNVKLKVGDTRRHLARYDTRRWLRHPSCPHTKVGCCYLPRYRYDQKRDTPRHHDQKSKPQPTNLHYGITGGVLSYVPRVMNRWFVRNARNYHRGVVSCPVAPVAYQVILEPGIGQFREFEPRRVHTRTNSLGLFLMYGQIDLRKARERELATLDEQSTSSGIAEPYAR